jgi:hypothetical protein
VNQLQHLTRLTEYETGRDVWLDLRRVASICRLGARVCEPVGDWPAQELGERTLLTVGDSPMSSEIYLVTETVEDIMALAKATGEHD